MQERVERAQRSRDSRSTRDRNHSPSLVLALEHVFGRPVRTERPPRSAVTASRDPLGLLDDDYMADESGLPWARTSSSLNRRRDLNDGSLWLTMAVEPDFLPRPQPSVERHAVSSIRSTLAPDHAVSTRQLLIYLPIAPADFPMPAASQSNEVPGSPLQQSHQHS